MGAERCSEVWPFSDVDVMTHFHSSWRMNLGKDTCYYPVEPTCGLTNACCQSSEQPVFYLNSESFLWLQLERQFRRKKVYTLYFAIVRILPLVSTMWCEIICVCKTHTHIFIHKHIYIHAHFSFFSLNNLRVSCSLPGFMLLLSFCIF